MIKPESKTALFFKPSRLLKRWSPLEIIHITRTTRGVETGREALDAESALKHFPAWEKNFRENMVALSDQSLSSKINELTRLHARQKAGTSLSNFVNRSFLRQVHQQLEQLWPSLCAEKIYHQVVNPATGNTMTTACELRPEKPLLSFAVHRDAEGLLALQTKLRLNDEEYELSAFSQELYFIGQNNQYFLLSYADYQVLQWLSVNDPAQYADEPAAFSEHILGKLSADYTVEATALDDATVVDTEPVNAIYLSEISNSFLLFTPRWNYDGFWTEGPWQHSERLVHQGKQFEIRRHREKEAAFVQYLQSLHPNFSKQLNGVYHLPFAEARKKHWFLKVYHQLLEKEVEMLGMEFLKQFRYAPDPVLTEMDIRSKTEKTVRLHLRVSCGKEEIPLLELQKLLIAGQKSLLLKDHSIVVLTEEWLSSYSVLLRHGKISGSTIELPHWLFLGLAEKEREQVPVLPQEWMQRWKQWQETETALYPLPAAIRADLRPYQQKGYEWFCLLQEIGAGACLADDMGLGKTLQTICFLARVFEQAAGKRPARAMIVCPASLLHNWRLEMEKFAPSLHTYVYHETGRSLESFMDGASAGGILITSYGTLRADLHLLEGIEWDAVVLDESHTIKNPAAQVTRAVYQLRADARIALSGTPVMNNSLDLYAQLQFLVPGLFGNLEFFRKQYAIPIDREQDEEKIQALQKLTAPFLLRRTKQQVATDLPPKTESVLWCEMGAAQKAFYEETLSQIRDSIFLNIKQEGLGKSKLSILQGMQKLRQICASPLLLAEAGTATMGSVKTELLLEELGNPLRDKKVLVFSQFKGMLQQIAKACSRAGIAYYHFDGDTPPAKRMELVEQFQQPENEVRVFLISLKAGNTGLNLTAAEYVFLVDPWWNTAVQQQAIDRAYRIGQQKNVFAYQMICKDSIEEKIVELQRRKKHLSDALVTEEEGFIKQLTEEDLQYLFS